MPNTSLLPSVALFAAALVLVSCSQKVTIKTDTLTGTEGFNFVKPNADARDPVHGKELWLGVGAVAGVNGTNANGVAQIHVMEDGVSLVNLQVNIYPPAQGREHRVWLVDDTGERVDLGTFSVIADVVRNRLNADFKRDLRTFTTVEITERASGSSVAGTVIAGGEVSERKR